MGLLDNKTSGKIRVLLWKSYYVRRYYWKTTLIEVLVPIIIALYVTWVIAKYSKQDVSIHPATYKPATDRNSVLSKTHVVNTLAYTPSCPFITKLLSNVISELNAGHPSNPVKSESMPTEDELEKRIINETQPALIMGIVFHNINASNCENPPEIFTYELRQSGSKDTRSLYPLKEKSGPYPNNDLYLDGGFAGFQLIMNEQYIKMKNPSWSHPNAEFQPFPYPEYETSSVPRDTLSFVICFSIIITLLALSVPFINHVTEEKGNGTKALMMIHGVNEWVIWFCWFIHAIMILVVSLTIMTVILKLPLSGMGTEPIRFVPFLIVWLMLILYCIANMSFSFLFCAIFDQGAFASFMFMVVSVIEIIINLCLRTLQIDSFAILFCLFPSTAFTKGFDMIRIFEEIGVTYPWKSIMITTDHRNPVSLFVALIMLVFDTILYTFLTYYVSAINPGKYGVKKSPLYFLESYIPLLRSNGDVEPDNTDNDWEENYDFIEPASEQEESSLQIKELYKEYGSFYAVNGIDMEMYESEITVLLGHNGAGKTTLLGIISGMIIPDGGSITYKGMDIIENQEEFRESLGVSFQEDRLFPYLSVKNHLLFYGMLKGFSRRESADEADNYLSRLDMYDDQNSWIKNINEGKRRKLSFMISLMGGSKVLLLDHPTSGMDLQSKIAIWDFLMDIREGRTIISTARDMHDAENIASRIAIMESGVLVSYGTIGFLKKLFGAAYELSITTESGNQKVRNFVYRYLPNTTVKHEASDEIVFKLQPSETPNFPAFFENLERSRGHLGISNIELGYTTVEQILLEVGSLSKSAPSGAESVDIISESQDVDIKEGYELTRLQLKTLFKKKFMYTSRTYMYAMARIVLPILMALLAVRIIEIYDFSPGPHLDLSLASYPGAIVMMKNNSSDSKQLYTSYVEKEGAYVIENTNENILEELIDFGRQKILQFRRRLILALEFGNPNRVIYNQWMLHSLPIAVTTYSNMLLKNVSGSDSRSEIFSINHPIPNVEQSCFVESLVTQRQVLTSMLFFVFTFFTVDILLYFFEFPNMEIARSLMHIQIISKVPVRLYWFTMFVFDFSFFVIIVAVRIALFKLIDDAYHFITFSPSFRVLIGIILLFGVSGLFFVYVLSFCMKQSKETLIKLFVFNFLCSVGVLLYIQYNNAIFEVLEPFGAVVRVIEIILLLIPFINYNLLVFRYMEIWRKNTICQLCAHPLIPQCLSQLQPLPFLVYPSQENPNGLLLGFIFLLVDIFLYFILLCLINAGFFSRISKFFHGSKINDEFSYKNDDVRQEGEFIQEIKESESMYNEVPLLVDGLHKHYFKSLQSFTAAENISFMAENGMCFGILGVHGSGKTTVLKMLSTEIFPTSGDVSIRGTSLTADKKEYISSIGYCPQSSPLMDELTGKEMLTLIALLRGIPGSDAEVLTDQWISFLKLEKYQYRKCGTYSDGSKRKLCTAISLIGNPGVVFLDEPTTDLDPVSTRRLHDIIKRCKQAGITVVLASPNMEECEILCDRLTILVQGAMHCIGTLKDLKKKYAHGFSVTFKIHYDINSLDQTFALEDFMMNTFNPKYCELIEEQRGILRYHISDPSMQWSSLFRNLEQIKYNNPIVDEYVATNTTLEDIFIAFSEANSSEYD